MSYRSGVYGMECLGIPSGPPTISCDGPGCDVKFEMKSRGMRSFPPTWFDAGKAVPRWSGGRTKEGTRVDYCPKCRPANQGSGGAGKGRG